ncbi:hypothetical protein FACS1894216_21190 [Synergistales bacterium]|nr:hypothetical protein FACS1894216_21190 [Synergistales bacterium]
MSKKCLIFGLFLVSLCLTCFSYNAVEAAESQVATRYTALVLDLSGSMSGNPLVELRKAAKTFCGQVLSAQGNNYIAIITLEGNVFSDFTNVPADLYQAIDTMNGYESDPTQGLNKVKHLFAEAGMPVNKNIIVMSDGQPGNTIPATNAAQALWPYYKVYSLGFFHSISGTSKTQAEEFLRGLQNAGFYEVADGNELGFAFNDIGEDITDGDNKNPIIFIPGIMGSELFTDKACLLRAWLPVGHVFAKSDLSLAPDAPHLYVEYPVDQQTVFFLLRTYGTELFPVPNAKVSPARKIMDTLREEFPERPLYFFSYDWRLSCMDNAKSLETFINEKSFNKIDIVAHSMGGLVASEYFRTNESKINKIITLATPYEGSPVAITRAISYTEMMGNLIADTWFTLLSKISPEIKKSFPAMAELAPTVNYYTDRPMRKWDMSRYEQISNNDHDHVLEKIFQGNVNSAKVFHDRLQSNGYNLLLNYDKAYFILPTGESTIGTILVDSSLNPVAISYDNGDGTVPYLSASIMGRVEELPSWRWSRFNGSHTDIISNEGALNWLVGTLRQGISDVKSDEYSKKPYTTIRVACPVDVTIAYNDVSLSSKNDSFRESAPFGRMDIIGENSDIKMFCLDDGAFPVAMEGTGTGTMDYSIYFFDEDDNLQDERNFIGVPITNKTIITTSAGHDASTILYIDENGDGKADRELEAKPNETITDVGDSSNGNSAGGCSSFGLGFGAFALIAAALLRKGSRR